MKSTPSAQLTRRLDRAKACKNPRRRVPMLLRAIRDAETSVSPAELFAAHNLLLPAALVSDQWELARTTYERALQLADAAPGSVELWSVLYFGVHVLAGLDERPEYSLEAIRDGYVDLEARSDRRKFPLHELCRQRLEAYLALGQPEHARAWLRRYRALPERTDSRCPACDENREFRFERAFGDPGRGLERGLALVDGPLRCGVVPRQPAAQLLAPLVALGRLEDAERMHRAGYSSVRNASAPLDTAGEHLAYLTHRGRRYRGTQLLRRHLPRAVGTHSTHERMSFYASAAAFLSTLETGVISMELPPGAPCFAPDGAYRVDALREALAADALALSLAFDRRNGNTFVSESVRRAIAPR